MFELIQIEFQLKYTWKIVRGATDSKTNFIIKFKKNGNAYYGEVAPNARYGESSEKIIDEFQRFNAVYKRIETDSLEELINVLDQLPMKQHSLQFGIESAFIHYLADKRNIQVYEYFGLKKPENIFTSYSLPIMDPAEIEDFIKPLSQFKFLKIKVDYENAYDVLTEVHRVTDKQLFVDGNESWKDVESLIKLMEKLSHIPITFLEQPMPSTMIDDYKHLKKHSKTLLIADESIENAANFEELSLQFDGINIKLMKTGGYIKALNLINEALQKDMKIMIGCMVESSIGISSALNIASLADYVDLDGFLIIKDEPFGLVSVNNGQLSINKRTIVL